MKKKIVLDKSFLQGCSRDKFLEYSKKFIFYLPESVFYELLTTSVRKRIFSFSKLVGRDNPVILIHNVGFFLRYELANQKPCKTINAIVTKFPFEFNQNLASEKQTISISQQQALEEWIDHENSEIKEFVEYSKILHELFPSIGQFKPGQNEKAIDEVKAIILSPELALKKYKDSFNVLSEFVNEEWAHFRWFQIKTLAALELIRSYGSVGEIPPNLNKIENLYFDFHQLLAAVQCQGIATNDNWLKNTLESLNTNSLILSL